VRQIFPVAASSSPIGLIEPAGAVGAVGTVEPIGGPGRAEPGGPGLAEIARLYAYPASAARPGRPWVRANFVASVDGAATAQGRSGGLSGEADRQVFSVLRSLADVIVAGAGTVRAEKYRPVQESEAWAALRAGRPPTPPIAVVTRQLDLDPDGPLLTGAPRSARTIVLTTDAAPADRRAAAARHADVVVAGRDMLSPEAITGALADRGHRRILIEGGPHLLGQIAAAGLLDELCLTLSPLLAGGQSGRILAAGAAGGYDIPAAQAGLSLAHVLEDSGFLLCRYVRTEAS
jgi:riboflavin biosynthesis pyrimidine reductase